MRKIMQWNTLSPNVRAEMLEMGLLDSRRSLGPALLLSILLLDIAAAVVSLVSH